MPWPRYRDREVLAGFHVTERDCHMYRAVAVCGRFSMQFAEFDIG